MTPEQQETWNRIEAFEIDEPGVPAPFSVRLAKEQGWTQGYTLRAIQEYKRFAFLSTVSSFPVTPSKVVDEVWHLHLIYTRNYWEDFCGKALGRRLHHHPGTGREEDESRFQRQYAETLELYRSFFGPEPEDCWGTPDEGSKPETVQTNKPMKAKAFKQLLNGKLINFFGPKIGIGLLVLLLAAHSTAQQGPKSLPASAQPLGVLDLTGPEFLRFYTVLGFMCLTAAVVARYLLARTNRPVDDRAKLGLYESAFLSQGMFGVATAASIKLAEEGKIILGEGGKISQVQNPTKEHPVEVRLLHMARASLGKRLYECFSSLDGFKVGLMETLEPTGLVLNADERRKTQLIPALIMATPLLVGIPKMIVGLQRERPISLLVIESIVFLLAALAFGFIPCIKSRQGEQWVQRAQWQQKNASQVGASPEQVALIAGVAGLSAMAGPQHAYYRQSVSSPSSGVDGGSSCGGGGGGCGGGGCGGCGS